VSAQGALLTAYEAGGFTLEEVQAAATAAAQGAFPLDYLGSVPVAAARLTATMLDMFGNQVGTLPLPSTHRPC
jgi:hypothetical protein